MWFAVPGEVLVVEGVASQEPWRMPRSRLAMVRSLLVAGAVGTLAVVDGSGSGRVREALHAGRKNASPRRRLRGNRASSTRLCRRLW